MSDNGYLSDIIGTCCFLIFTTDEILAIFRQPPVVQKVRRMTDLVLV
jgi:hypothetical protein